MTVIVDYGLGNVGSILNMLRHVGCHDAVITGDPSRILCADKLILPGVGHFDTGMKNLRERGLVEVLTEVAVAKCRPTLGICLGMQLMTRGSEEGILPGLAWVDGDFKRFSFGLGCELKIPHMGWNEVRMTKPDKILHGFSSPPRFYFVHSFHLANARQADVSGISSYGYEFGASFSVENLFGVQFHPEKSHRFGMAVLANFAKL
jgi:glutamine amidotransferase